MRAGQFDKTITIQGLVTTIDDFGTPTEAWSDFATVRAQRIETNTEEYLRGYGETDETVAIFRTRWLDGVTTGQRIAFGGKNFNVRETKELGRRQGLEIRCEEVRT